MRKRLELAQPDECLLYQAVFWVSDKVPPIDNIIFLSLPDPATLGPTAEDKRELLLALKSGLLKATGIFWGTDGPPYCEIEDKTVEISPDSWEWDAVTWEESILQAPRWFGTPGAFNCIMVRTSELMEVFAPPADLVFEDAPRTGSAMKNSPASTPTRRGRPSQYDWLAFHAEIAVRADLDGLPETQTKLERSMADWCQDTWGEIPAESTIREKISPIYKHTRKAGK